MPKQMPLRYFYKPKGGPGFPTQILVGASPNVPSGFQEIDLPTAQKYAKEIPDALISGLGIQFGKEQLLTGQIPSSGFYENVPGLGTYVPEKSYQEWSKTQTPEFQAGNINIGTPEKPLWMPKGSPGAILQQEVSSRAGGKSTPVLASIANNMVSQPQTTIYEVKAGDTLSAIGAKFGVDWRKITGYRSGNPNLIYPGEVLTIPTSTSGLPVSPYSGQYGTWMLQGQPLEGYSGLWKEGYVPYEAPAPVKGSGTYVEDLTKNIQQQIQQTTSQISDLQSQQSALAKYGLADTSQLTKDESGNYVPIEAPEPPEKEPPEKEPPEKEPPETVGTSAEARAALKEELEEGLTKPTLYNSVAEYDRLRTEQGIVDDENELNAIRNEANLAKQELRQFKAGVGKEITMGGYTGRVSEAEQNVSFRLEDLAIREQAVVARLNSKNSYISTVMDLGYKDYQSAYQEYTDEWNKNLKVQQLLGEKEEKEATAQEKAKEDAQVSLNTMTT